MKKPTVLLYQGDSTFFDDVRSDFNLVFIHPDKTLSPIELVQKTIRRFHADNIKIDGVVGTTDEASIFASYTADLLKLPGTKPHSIYAAQNKAAFSNIVAKITPHLIADFQIITKEQPIVQIPFPVYIKPVKGVMSKYAFKISSQEELNTALDGITFHERDNINWYNEFFQKEGTTDIKSSDSFIAQKLIKGRQLTVDGYVSRKKVYIIGFTESILNETKTSFVRFDHPAMIDNRIETEILSFLEKYTATTHYDNAGFNLEFFITETGEIQIIEFNTRISGQFSPLFACRYTESSLRMIFDLAVGHDSILKINDHPQAASSFPLRVYEDKKVVKVPTATEIAEIKKLHPEIVEITIKLKSGTNLSDYRQDSYSYRYGIIDIKGDSIDKILKSFEIIMSQNLGIILESRH